MLADMLRGANARLSDVEAWLVRRIAANPAWAETVRAELESATAAVVTAYEFVRTPTYEEKVERKCKRRSPLERVRKAIEERSA